MPVKLQERFVAGADGGRLACTLWGSGVPLVRVPEWLSHQGLLRRHPQEQAFVASLGALSPPWMEIAYDKQGTGLSRRERAEFSFGGMVSELAAIVDHLALSRFALLCPSTAGLLGLAYAAEHPARVSHLILVNSAARGSQFQIPGLIAAISAIAGVAEAEWSLGTEALAQLISHAMLGGELDVPPATPRDRVGLDTALALWAAYCNADLTALLPQVRVPTLVVHSRSDRVVHFAAGVELASAIPGARFYLVDGATHSLFRGSEVEQARSEILRFLREPAPARRLSQAGNAEDATPLTQQQVTVLRLIAAGKSSREIALELVLSARTVQRHIANLYAKLGIHNRAEATALALRISHG